MAPHYCPIVFSVLAFVVLIFVEGCLSIILHVYTISVKIAFPISKLQDPQTTRFTNYKTTPVNLNLVNLVVMGQGAVWMKIK